MGVLETSYGLSWLTVFLDPELAKCLRFEKNPGIFETTSRMSRLTVFWDPELGKCQRFDNTQVFSKRQTELAG